MKFFQQNVSKFAIFLDKVARNEKQKNLQRVLYFREFCVLGSSRKVILRKVNK